MDDTLTWQDETADYGRKFDAGYGLSFSGPCVDRLRFHRLE